MWGSAKFDYLFILCGQSISCTVCHSRNITKVVWKLFDEEYALERHEEATEGAVERQVASGEKVLIELCMEWEGGIAAKACSGEEAMAAETRRSRSRSRK